MTNMIFETMRCVRTGGILVESYENGAWFMRFEGQNGAETLSAYTLDQLCEEESHTLWNGLRPEELLRHGRDVLGEQVLSQGEPDYETVRRLLPPITRQAYCFLSGAASWGGVLVDRQGQIFPQSSGGMRQPNPLFSPVLEDGVLGEQAPRQFLLGGHYPVLFSVHSDENDVLELMYFVEPGDPDRDPIVWIRVKRYKKRAPQECSVRYQIAALSRRTSRQIEEGTFLTALADTVAWWCRFETTGAQFKIPEKELQNAVYGTLMACATTFTGDHAHYGHMWYGAELHDNFPPNYIWALEACCLLGHHMWGRRILQHLLTYVLNDNGRFVYRQGEHELFGASAEEYGQLLFVIERYSSLLGCGNWPEEYYLQFISMGNVLLENCVPCPEFGGRVLIRMCAEADTNTRVHVYLNNNLWGIRGLQALVRLLEIGGHKAESSLFADMSSTLLENIRALSDQYAEPSDYGPLVPFRFGYTAKPLTLSTCEDTFVPVTEEELRRYLVPSHERHSQGSEQDLTENTYANYRYYPEALSAMLLDPTQSEALVRMREALGGEYMGMTRFYGWLDDWPVAHYARYLLESGRIEKYLLLLYAHTAHHGHPDLMCYYEQVTTDGAMVAPDCVPVLLTTDLLTAWMFAYETVAECRLQLLTAVPKSWFEKGFSAQRLGYSGGTCSVEWDGKRLTVLFSTPTVAPVEIVWRCKDTLAPENITSGLEFVERMQKNRILLRPGVTTAVLEIC